MVKNFDQMIAKAKAKGGRLLGKAMPRRAAVYLTGNFLIALGVILSVKSSLGVTPVQSIPYAISRLLGADQGIVTTAVYCFYVALQMVLLRSRFRPSGFLQIIIAIIFGLFVSLCVRLAAFPDPAAYYARLLFLGSSVILIALGLFLYLSADLIPQPAEGLILAVAALTGWKVPNIKIGLDCAMVAVAVFVSFAATGGVIGVREGTFIAMVSVGKVLGVFFKRWGDKLQAFCFEK